MHVVEIYLPIVRDEAFGAVLAALRERLARTFGGVTIFSRAPAKGDWIAPGSSETESDDVIVVETMVEDLDRAWWAELRENLERDLAQQSILIRVVEALRL